MIISLSHPITKSSLFSNPLNSSARETTHKDVVEEVPGDKKPDSDSDDVAEPTVAGAPSAAGPKPNREEKKYKKVITNCICGQEEIQKHALLLETAEVLKTLMLELILLWEL